MNLSSGWCVTAAFALVAAGCSDPVPPPAQGAFRVDVNAPSPQPAGKACPAGASLTFDAPPVPTIIDPMKGPEWLDEDTYVHKVIDGEGQAEVSCTVKGGTTFTIEGSIAQGSRLLSISGGTLGADKKGTASVAVRNSGTPGFSGTLRSPSANCTLDAVPAAGNRFQVKPGSIWARFSCPSVEAPPSDYCVASGIFVFENCNQ